MKDFAPRLVGPDQQWNECEPGSEGRHQNGCQAFEATAYDQLPSKSLTFKHGEVYVVTDLEDAVACRDAGQRDEANHTGDRQRLSGNPKRHYASDQGQRDIHKNNGAEHGRLVARVKHQEDALRAAGLRVVMVTGDNAATAAAVAKRLGINDVEADVLPQHKSEIVEKFRRQGRVVAMAGDGVNDAPALAAADVGIAMGTGTDVAMESAGITLLKGDLNGIVRARHLSAAAMSNIRQNLFFAFIYNAAGVPVAAGALYPLFGVLLSPVIAAAAMALSSVSVIANALRLRGASL